MRWLALGLAVLLGSCTTAADIVRTDNPVAVLEYFATLGRTINLRDTGQVQLAIGDVQGAVTRGSRPPGFVGYTFPAGEIVFNPDTGRGRWLGVSLHACIPTSVIRARLRGPEFLASSFRATVAVYENVPYRDNPRTTFSFFDTGPGCVRNFGITQWNNEI